MNTQSGHPSLKELSLGDVELDLPERISADDLVMGRSAQNRSGVGLLTKTAANGRIEAEMPGQWVQVCVGDSQEVLELSA